MQNAVPSGGDNIRKDALVVRMPPEMELDSTLNTEAQSYAAELTGRTYDWGSSSKITKGKGENNFVRSCKEGKAREPIKKIVEEM